MQIPVIHGTIDRRILVNFRVDPDILARILPAPFKPKLINGAGMAGVCLIRLKQVTPQFVPTSLGLNSENAAHRIAVTWEQDAKTFQGVYVPRRDTSSHMSHLLGGRLFPGIQHHAHFSVIENEDRYHIALDSDDGDTHLLVEGHTSLELAGGSIFGSLQAASDFFEAGALGYSASAEPGRYDGLELHSFNWKVEPLAVEKVESSFFTNPNLFPEGSIKFDCALLMRNINHEWHGRESLFVNSSEGIQQTSGVN
jgi:hypothetical protein